VSNVQEILEPGEYFVELAFRRAVEPSVLLQALTAMGWTDVMFDEVPAPVTGISMQRFSPAMAPAARTAPVTMQRASLAALALPTAAKAPPPALTVPAVAVKPAALGVALNRSPSSVVLQIPQPGVDLRVPDVRPTIKPNLQFSQAPKPSVISLRAPVPAPAKSVTFAPKPSVISLRAPVPAPAKSVTFAPKPSVISLRPPTLPSGLGPKSAIKPKLQPTYKQTIAAKAMPSFLELKPRGPFAGPSASMPGGGGGGGGGGGDGGVVPGYGGGEVPGYGGGEVPGYGGGEVPGYGGGEVPGYGGGGGEYTPAPYDAESDPMQAIIQSLQSLSPGSAPPSEPLAGEDITLKTLRLMNLWRRWLEWGSPFATSPHGMVDERALANMTIAGSDEAEPTRLRFVGRVHRRLALSNPPGMWWVFVKKLALDYLSDVQLQAKPFQLLPGRCYEFRVLARDKSAPHREDVKNLLASMGFAPMKLTLLRRFIRLPNRPSSLSMWLGMGQWLHAPSVVTVEDPFYFEQVKEIAP
jgi:hypothetical protein